MEQYLQIIRALAEETRVKILDLLEKQALCGKALAKRLNITEAAISQHIKVLTNAGVIVGRKRGYHIHYLINRETLARLSEELSRMAQATDLATACGRVQAITQNQTKEAKEVCQGCCQSRKMPKVTAIPCHGNTSQISQEKSKEGDSSRGSNKG